MPAVGRGKGARIRRCWSKVSYGVCNRDNACGYRDSACGYRDSACGYRDSACGYRDSACG